MTTRSMPAAVVTLLLALSATPARAEGSGATSDRLFAEAMTLIDEERFADAIPKLEEAQRLDPGIGTQFNLAACYVKVGRMADAWRNLVEVERLARVAGKRQREDSARQMLEEIRPLVHHLVVDVVDVANVRQTVVRLDDRAVASGELDFVPLDPGEHRVEAIAPGKQPFSVTVVVAESALATRVEIPALAPLEPRTEVRTVTRDRLSTKRSLGVAFAGLGVAGLATATVTGIMILSAKSTAEERCRPDCVTASGEPDGVGNDAVQRGKDLLPINLVAWVLAGVGGAGAAIWLISLPKTAPPKKAAPAPLGFGGTVRDGGGFATVSTSF